MRATAVCSYLLADGARAFRDQPRDRLHDAGHVGLWPHGWRRHGPHRHCCRTVTEVIKHLAALTALPPFALKPDLGTTHELDRELRAVRPPTDPDRADHAVGHGRDVNGDRVIEHARPEQMDVVLGYRKHKMPRQPCLERIVASEHALCGLTHGPTGDNAWVPWRRPIEEPRAPTGGAVAHRADKRSGVDRTADAFREFLEYPSITDLVGAATFGHSVLIGQPDRIH
jgi:hypothetical protein